MPYIDQEDRDDVRPRYERPAFTKGELNFQFTSVALDYLREHGLSYDTLNDISGAFTEAAAEFRRRVTVPYEERKRAINGDVYPGA